MKFSCVRIITPPGWILVGVAVVAGLERLQELNRSANHYRLGPYHSFLARELAIPYIQAVNDPDADVEMRTFCGGRYVVAGIDEEDVELDLFGDNDIQWAANLVNALGERAKSLLGLEDGVFGVVNELAPAPEELAVVEQDPSEHVVPISELTPEAECGLRIRYVGEQEAVQMEIGRLGAMRAKSSARTAACSAPARFAAPPSRVHKVLRRGHDPIAEESAILRTIFPLASAIDERVELM